MNHEAKFANGGQQQNARTRNTTRRVHRKPSNENNVVGRMRWPSEILAVRGKRHWYASLLGGLFANVECSTGSNHTSNHHHHHHHHHHL